MLAFQFVDVSVCCLINLVVCQKCIFFTCLKLVGGGDKLWKNNFHLMAQNNEWSWKEVTYNKNGGRKTLPLNTKQQLCWWKAGKCLTMWHFFKSSFTVHSTSRKGCVCCLLFLLHWGLGLVGLVCAFQTFACFCVFDRSCKKFLCQTTK